MQMVRQDGGAMVRLLTPKQSWFTYVNLASEPSERPSAATGENGTRRWRTRLRLKRHDHARVA